MKLNQRNDSIDSFSSFFSRTEEKEKSPALWKQLFENYQEILLEKKNEQAIISFIEIVKRNLLIKPLQNSLPTNQWAKLMWRWAFNIV